jgi:hypothetical protein
VATVVPLRAFGVDLAHADILELLQNMHKIKMLVIQNRGKNQPFSKKISKMADFCIVV